MREFTAADGTRWDVLVGRESFGTLVLLFSCRGRAETRSLVVGAESVFAAERELEALDEAALQARLDEARVA